ncbi:MAG: MgtC/SapB family protein, partial [Deltaproteobacteria bacterium]|nr:MgtC/SapB family protein [Deltaproteobacteria bacterium]
MSPDVLSETICKLLLATLLGGLIGFERETHGQAAGFRTYILVSLGCCLIMMTSLHLHDIFKHFDSNSSVRIDPGRIASYALAGMGFMGAGAIIVGKGTVKGLTTAAGMWMIAAVGLAVGSGYFVPAISVT